MKMENKQAALGAMARRNMEEPATEATITQLAADLEKAEKDLMAAQERFEEAKIKYLAVCLNAKAD